MIPGRPKGLNKFRHEDVPDYAPDYVIEIEKEKQLDSRVFITYRHLCKINSIELISSSGFFT